MAQLKFCQHCKQEHNCQKVCEQLGRTEGPPVVIKVILAFLLPLVVFIASLAAFQEILTRTIDAQNLLTALSLVLASLATSACILIVGVMNGRLSQGR